MGENTKNSVVESEAAGLASLDKKFYDHHVWVTGVFRLFLPERAVLSGFMAMSFIAAIVLIGGNRRYVREIYNRGA